MFEKLLIFLRLKKRKPLTLEQRQFVSQATSDALKELEEILCGHKRKQLDLSVNFLTDNATKNTTTQGTQPET